MTAKPLDWKSWHEARNKMTKIYAGWSSLDQADDAMAKALRSGKVHCRGEFREFDWQFGKGDSVALQDVISTLRKLRVYSDEAVVEYEITITEMTTFGSDLFRVLRPHTRKSERTAWIGNPELVWPEFRDYLIRFELPSGPMSNRTGQRRRKHTLMPPRQTKLGVVQSYITRTYPSGIPAGVTDKAIARATGVSERTARRARKPSPT
jgi:hypothetical protein